MQGQDREDETAQDEGAGADCRDAPMVCWKADQKCGGCRRKHNDGQSDLRSKSGIKQD